MISRSDDPNRDSGRVLRIALVISLVLHPLVFALLAMLASITWLHPPVPERVRKPLKDEVVTISTATRRAPRAVAQVQPHSQRAERPSVVQPRRIPRPQSIPHPLVRPQPAVVAAAPRKPLPVPTYRPPARVRRELAKIVAHAAPQPKAQTPKPETPEPVTPEPQTPAPKTVAALQRPEVEHEARTPVSPRSESVPARYSQAQIDQIESDLAKSIKATRGLDAPLSSASKQVAVAAAPKHFPIDFQAVDGNLRSAQGVCDPLRSWTQDGWDYYWAACNVVEPDGSMRRKPMPWPVRWRPRDDPWNGNVVTRQGPMPLPPPGWRPDPAHPLDADFTAYLRQRGYTL